MPLQDLLLRMMAFLEEDANKGMCILSANGVISNVALASGGMMVTYEVFLHSFLSFLHLFHLNFFGAGVDGCIRLEH